jgi:hypothetical protein
MGFGQCYRIPTYSCEALRNGYPTRNRLVARNGSNMYPPGPSRSRWGWDGSLDIG